MDASKNGETDKVRREYLVFTLGNEEYGIDILKVEGLSGATIMGDGRVALILDVAAIVRANLQKSHGEVLMA